MSDQRMNASDQGSQPDSGSSPNDQVNVDGQGAIRGRAGQNAQPEASNNSNATQPKGESNVTEAAHKEGQG